MKLTKAIIKQLIREALANLNRQPPGAPEGALKRKPCKKSADCRSADPTREEDTGERCHRGECVPIGGE